MNTMKTNKEILDDASERVLLRKAGMPFLAVYSSGNGNPPGVLGMATCSSTLWLRYRRKWYALPNDRSLFKVAKKILDVLGVTEDSGI